MLDRLRNLHTINIYVVHCHTILQNNSITKSNDVCP